MDTPSILKMSYSRLSKSAFALKAGKFQDFGSQHLFCKENVSIQDFGSQRLCYKFFVDIARH